MIPMKRFRERRWHTKSEETEANPLELIANLADAMLILSVGFMLALVANWNIDISAAASAGSPTVTKEDALTFDQKDMKKVEDNAKTSEGGDLEKLGTVYYDSAEGKYYIIDGKEN